MEYTEPKLMKLFKRNYKFMIAESSLFWVAAAFIDGNTVVSVFIHQYTGSMQLAGLSAVIRTFSFMLAQFLMGMVQVEIADKMKAMRMLALFSRGLPLLMVPALLSPLSDFFSAGLLVVLLGLFFFGDGCLALIWTNLTARTIPDKFRGQMIGNSQMLAGVLSIAAGFLIKFILSGSLEPDIKYSIIFGICGTLFCLNTVFIFLLRDREDMQPQVRRRYSLRQYIGAFAPIWNSEPRIRKVIICRAIYAMALMASPLVVLFGTSSLNMTTSQTSSMVYIQMSGMFIGGFFWGRISRYFMPHAIMIGSMFAASLLGAIGVSAYLLGSAALVYSMVFLVGFIQMAWVGYTNELIRLSNEENRPIILVMQSLAQVPAAFGPYFAGLVAEKLGFLPVFAAVLAFGVLGSALVLRLRTPADKNATDTLALGG
ncbi:MAG: MFS transporter [Christensenellales bacterium]|jgi:MFS family permease